MVRCKYCRCTKKGRHKIWCSSKEAKKIRKEIEIERKLEDEND